MGVQLLQPAESKEFIFSRENIICEPEN